MLLMARSGARDARRILVKQGVFRWVLGFYLINNYVAHGAEQGQNADVLAPISRLILAVETADGKRYAYKASPSVTAMPLQPHPAPEGWFHSFSRSLAVGVSVPLVLLGLSEWFSLLKQRYRHRAMKDRARQRRRLLRRIYAVQDELQDLEDESRKMKDELGSSQEDTAVSGSTKARKQSLRRKLHDLHYQLRDLYEYSSSQIEATSGVHDSGERPSRQDESTFDRATRAHRPPGKQSDSLGTTTMAEFPVEGAGGTKHPASSNADLPLTARDELRGKEVFQLARPGADDKHRDRRHRLNGLPKQSRMEIVRQLVDEVPGMPPQEVLRMAENVSARGR